MMYIPDMHHCTATDVHYACCMKNIYVRGPLHEKDIYPRAGHCTETEGGWLPSTKLCTLGPLCIFYTRCVALHFSFLFETFEKGLGQRERVCVCVCVCERERE